LAPIDPIFISSHSWGNKNGWFSCTRTFPDYGIQLDY